MKNKLSTQPYKGTRDFFPEEMRQRKRIFAQLERVAELFGYEPYDGPMLEPFSLYAAKTGEEIVNEQLYSFEDRGGRHLAIRPEMTPTLARMVAQKSRELAKPIRWYSLPNLWRYENPQKGRLREHWQLNVDLFGINEVSAEIEILILAIELLQSFGADSSMFRLYYNHRAMMDQFLARELGLGREAATQVAKAIDKKAKVSTQEFQRLLEQSSLGEEQHYKLHQLFDVSFAQIPELFPSIREQWQWLETIKERLFSLGYGDYIVFSPEVVRGFDYYTGVVFEIYDQNPDNRRSLFGGGRYDNLVGLFGGDSLSGVGFGMGDVTFVEFLRGHNLLPSSQRSAAVMIALFPGTEHEQVWSLARVLRDKGITVEVPWGVTKLGKQFQSAEKKGLRYIILPDAEELEHNRVLLKDLLEQRQFPVVIEEMADYVTSSK